MKQYFPLLFLVIYSAAQAQGLYRWVDEDGKVHYSDTVPAKVSRMGHDVLNKQGQTKKRSLGERDRSQIETKKWVAVLEQKRETFLAEKQVAEQQQIAGFSSLEELKDTYQKRLDDFEAEFEQLQSQRKKLVAENRRLRKQFNGTDRELRRERIRGFLDKNEDNIAQFDHALKTNRVEAKKVSIEADMAEMRYNRLIGQH